MSSEHEVRQLPLLWRDKNEENFVRRTAFNGAVQLKNWLKIKVKKEMAKIKKAFIKTVEILLVIIITTIFVLSIASRQAENKPSERISVLNKLEKDSGFRGFVMENSGCYNSASLEINYLIAGYLPDNYDYLFCISEKSESLPQKEVYLDTLFFAGNITDIRFKTLRLYYWLE